MSWLNARHAAALGVGTLVAALVPVLGVAPAGAADVHQQVTSDGETTPTTHAGDSIDDPAVWVHPTDPSRSLVIGNDKLGALETYGLDGSLVQRLSFSTQFWGNVDVLRDATVGGRTRDLVGVVQRGVRFYTVDPDSRQLASATEADAPIGENGEGFCLYQSPATDRAYGFSITIEGLVSQFELLDADADGRLESRTVRTFQVGSEAESCVADPATGALYVSEENRALWRYSAEPGGGSAREAVDVLTSAGGHLVNDVEGVTLVDQPDGAGYLIVSAQGDAPESSYFAVYRRGAGNDFVKTFRVAAGATSDDCDHTDGITASTAALGPRFPQGVFVCQDDDNDLPGTSGNQDLKLVRLEKVVDLDGGEQPPPAPAPRVSFVAQSSTNANATAFSATVPAATRPGDVLLLWASQNTEGVLSGPGAGWTQVGRTVDTGHATTLWRRVAGAADPGSTVRLTSGTTYTKVALSLAAYRGVDPASPVVAAAGVAEPRSATTHTTPLLASTTDQALRVSYWSDKSSATTAWQAPMGESVRASTSGTGGGRVTTVLTDPGRGLEAGNPPSTGGLVATADAASSVGTAWTVLLRPAPVADDTSTPVTFVGQATSNGNNLAFSVPVPAAVRSGDLLLLFASQNTSTPLIGPGTGWTEAGRVVDGDHATTVWRRTAAASDAGSSVRLSSGPTWTKVALTLAAYRGAHATDPLVSTTGVPEPATTTRHTTPRVGNAVDGALRVSYWSDRTSATSAWTAPAAETRRAVTVGSGGGRVSSLLTEGAGPLVAGSPTTTGGLVAEANASADRATSWTLLLRPAP